MKKIYSVLAVLSVLFANTQADAQAFRKGSLVLTFSEGATITNYTTTNIRESKDVYNTVHAQGNRDPLALEYGISDRWGVGLSMGSDIYKVDPDHMYNYVWAAGKINSVMGEISAEVNYHCFVTKRVDIAAYSALGLAGVNFTVKDDGKEYNYNCGGTIVRLGVKAKYYVFKRVGFLGMVSAFSTHCTTTGDQPGYTGESHPYATSIKGVAAELGLCYRILK